ncbi:MAG: hypothetical protein LBH35_09710, partial [Treponema sp.]|nr:hypothetical protein [Treponema sp.]
LASNGLDKAILTCAVQQGGTRKIAERFEHYFNLGVDVLSGKDNWDESLAEGTAPHAEDSPAAAPNGTDAPQAGPNGNPPPQYKRWKPE